MPYNENDDYFIYKIVECKNKKLGYLLKYINNIIVSGPNNRGDEYDANLIINNLWLGNHKVAYDIDFIREKNINYMINVTNDYDNKFNISKYMKIPIKDENACYQDILSLMIDGSDFINYAIKNNGNILVHCKRGHHRSASIVALYLMRYENMTLINAISIIKKIRPTSFRRMTCMLKTLIVYEDNRSIRSNIS